MKFVGWTPTITGRLSFSAIGDGRANSAATLCNLTAFDQACIFGIQNRTSKDSPLPPCLLRFWNRIEQVQFVVFLDTGPAGLPVQSATDPGVLIQDDPRGALIGTAIAIIAKEGTSITPAQLEELKGLTRQASNPANTEKQREAYCLEATAKIEELWLALKNLFNNNVRLAPAFARASVRLLRSGQTEIDVAPQDLYFTEGSRRAHILNPLCDTYTDFESDADLTARQVFHFIRDLAHRHYHHPPHSDLATTTYLADKGDDHTWRKNTHFGLLRMAISSRRHDNLETYKQALGILAYGEAFQFQLASWHQPSGATPVSRFDFYPYNFEPFRESIKSKISYLETRSVSNRKHSVRAALRDFPACS